MHVTSLPEKGDPVCGDWVLVPRQEDRVPVHDHCLKDCDRVLEERSPSASRGRPVHHNLGDSPVLPPKRSVVGNPHWMPPFPGLIDPAAGRQAVTSLPEEGDQVVCNQVFVARHERGLSADGFGLQNLDVIDEHDIPVLPGLPGFVCAYASRSPTRAWGRTQQGEPAAGHRAVTA